MSPLYNPSQQVEALLTNNLATQEKTTVTCIDDTAEALQSKYFLINSGSTSYYAWINIDGGGSDPALVGKTAIPVAVGEKEQSSITTIADVAGSLGGKYFLLSSPTVDYYAWINVDAGSVDPALVGKTGIEVAITSGASANAVATAVASAVDALAAFVATPSTNTVTITNAVKGNVTDTAAGNSGFTAAVLRQGSSGSASVLAGLIATAVDGVGDLSASASGSAVNITVDATGVALDGSAGNSGFSVSVQMQGHTALYGPGTLCSDLVNPPADIVALT